VQVALQLAPASRGRQVPGDVAWRQLSQLPAQTLSQQMPSAPQTPLAHSTVDAQAAPGATLGRQVPPAAQ
jgi:hypothetical protein